MRGTLCPRHSLVAPSAFHLRLLTLLVMLPVFFSCSQIVCTAVWTLIFQAFKMRFQAAWRKLNFCVTEARHALYWRRVHVAARSTTMWTLLYLAIAKLTPLKL
jgi:hypothetical protein